MQDERIGRLRINEERFLKDLADLAQIGSVSAAEGGGLDRRPFSMAERAARDFFRQRAEEAGLRVEVDTAANLSALLPSSNRSAKILLFGSHLDTVPHGGPYDGALGTLAALETVRTIKESQLTLPVHLEAIAFTDEEGRLGDLTGSQVIAGTYSREQVSHFLAQAEHFPADLEAMRARVPGGLTIDSILLAQRDPEALLAFVELHIEQGPQLEHAGVPIGVVDAIFGRAAFQVSFPGRSDHAGTTPMGLRQDALIAASRFIVQANQLVRDQFPNAVLTCGNVTAQPGVYNVVPREAIVWVEFRAGDGQTLAAIEEELEKLLPEVGNEGREPSITVRSTALNPQAMDSTVQQAIRMACEGLGYENKTLSSGALHDAHSLAAIVPTGMIFVPSVNGRSHSPDECTKPEDLIAGANVLLQTVLHLARKDLPDR